jgi:hypothetical protein
VDVDEVLADVLGVDELLLGVDELLLDELCA